MSTTGTEGDELRSWKEIAEYLGVSIRTAQLWEVERDLPVKRLPGGRSRVSANLTELEAWKKSSAPPRRRLRAAAVAAALILAVLAAAFLHSRRVPQPASFRLEGNSLIVQDSQGRELWRKVFDSPLAPVDEGRQAWFGDLDADGETEVIFAPRTRFGAAVPLIAYSKHGGEKWRFLPGRAVSSPVETFAPIYVARWFAVFELAPGRRVVAVSSQHYRYYPNQVALLSPTGKLLREYWHSGHLRRLETADFNGDGVQEMYLGGISNGERAATLVVLDPRTFQGASVESDPDYQIGGFAHGNEYARLIFPRTCINRLFDEYNAVHSLVVEPERITVGVHEKISPPFPGMIYEFGRDLRLIRAIPNDRLRSFHRELAAANTLRHALTPAELAGLSGVRDLARPEISARRSRRASGAAGPPSSRGER